MQFSIALVLLFKIGIQMKKVKEIDFNEGIANNFYFDLVNLEDIIIKRQPSDHNQFNHHKLSFYAILIITSGKGAHCINYKDYTYNEGSIFTLRKNTIHKFYKTSAKGKLIIFTEDFIVRSSDKMNNLNLFKLFNEMLGSPKLQVINSDLVRIKEWMFQIEKEKLSIKEHYSIEIIRNLIQGLILNLLRLKSKGNENLAHKKNYSQFIKLQKAVEKDCFESKSVAYYANKLDVSTKTLSNITQSVVSKSAKSFIDEIVILQIKKILISSSHSYTEIAYRAGFEHSTNFFKYFRKKTGLSPKQFRENNNK